MKTMRKVLSVLLVLAMVLSLGAMAVSAAEKDGVVTVTDPQKGEVYKLYKLFDLTYDQATNPETATAPTTFAYTYTKGADPDAFLTALQSDGSPFNLVASVTKPGEFNVALKKALQGDQNRTQAEEAVINFLKANEAVLPTPAEKTAADANPLVFDKLDHGYYYLTSTSGTLVTLDSNTPTAEVQDKNEAPTVDKTADSAPDGTANVGDTIYFTVKIDAKKGAENYILTDEMSKGLTLQQPVVVYKDSQGTDHLDNTGNKSYEVVYQSGTEDTGDSFTLTFTEAYLDSIDEPISLFVKYSAVLNADAIGKTDPVTNKAELSYGHNATTSTTPVKETPIHTYGFDVVKTDEANHLLSGASFALYANKTDGTALPLFKDEAKGCYRPPVGNESNQAVTELPTVNGVLRIDGLANGTYYLEETKAPAGYNKLTERVAVVIKDGDLNKVLAQDGTYESGGVRVENRVGSELPSTGGMGTTMFYVLGAVLVLGAAIALVAKRRVREQ